METQWVCSMVAPGVVKDGEYEWRLPFLLYFWTASRQEVYMMQCDLFPQVNGRCLFFFSLKEWSGEEKWSLKKGENLWRPGVFPLFLGMFHLVKASE